MLRNWARSVLGATATLYLMAVLPSAALAASIRGTVVDADERPVAGASVWLHDGADDEFGDRNMTRIASCVTGRDGAFSIPYSGEPVDSLILCAYRPGSAVTCCFPPEPDRPLWLQLLPAQPLRGRVVDGDGEPIAGVSVGLVHAVGTSLVGPTPGFSVLPQELARDLGVLTDAQGRFELALVPAGWDFFLAVSFPGHGCVNANDRSKLERIVLPPAGSLAGRVQWPADGSAPTGALMSATRVSPFAGGYVTAFAAVDAQGSFRFAELPPGKYTVGCARQPDGERHVVGVEKVVLQSGKESEVALETVGAHPVRGRVVAADTSRPLPGAAVSLIPTAEEGGLPGMAEGTTDGDGRLEVYCMPGEAHLYVEDTAGYGQQEPGTVTVAEGGVDVGDIKLLRARRFAVRTVDDTGQPVRGAAVVEVTEGLQMVWALGHADAEGLLTIAGLDPGPTKLRAVKGALASDEIAVDPSEQEGVLTLSMRPQFTAGVRARIVDDDGRPSQGVTATLTATSAPARLMACPGPDAEGWLQVAGLVPETAYRLVVSCDDADPVQSQPWTARANAVQDLGTLKLRRHRGELHGVVVGPSGKPIAGAKVRVSLDARAVRLATADAEGRFSLSGLVAGWVYAFVDAPGCAYAAVPLQTGADWRRIALRKAHGTATGKPLPSPLPAPAADGRVRACALLVQTLDALRGQHAAAREDLLVELARLDPAAAYEAAARGKDDTGAVNLTVGETHLAQDFDESLALMQQGNDPYTVAGALIEAADDYLGRQTELARRCLDAALELGASIEDTRSRVMVSAAVGERLLRLGDPGARDLLLAAARDASAFGYDEDDARARRRVARAVCLVDLETAQSLVRPIPDEYGLASDLADFATILAPGDPAAALKLAEGVEDDLLRDDALSAVAGGLAGKRLEEALRVVDRVEGGGARALALIRVARAAPPGRVCELLDQAAQALEGVRDDRPPRNTMDGLARLSIAAQQLGVADYRQYAWRAAAMKARGAGDYGPDLVMNVLLDLELARITAYTDPALARHILLAGVSASGGMDRASQFVPPVPVLAAAAIDAEWGLSLLRQLGEPRGGQLPLQSRPFIRREAAVAVARALTVPPEERAREVLAESDDLGPEGLP